MPGRKKEKKSQLDLFELLENIQRDKKELEKVRDGLKELGNGLKKDHMRRMLEPEGISLDPEKKKPLRINRLCRKCLNSCKQTDEVKIFNCAKYEPVN